MPIFGSRARVVCYPLPFFSMIGGDQRVRPVFMQRSHISTMLDVFDPSGLQKHPLS